MDGTCGAGEIVDFIALDIERKCYVVANQFKTRISQQMINIAFGTGKEIVDADLYFIDKIGLQEHLSPTRNNGIVAMLKQMRLFALAYLSVLK